MPNPSRAPTAPPHLGITQQHLGIRPVGREQGCRDAELSCFMPCSCRTCQGCCLIMKPCLMVTTSNPAALGTAAPPQPCSQNALYEDWIISSCKKGRERKGRGFEGSKRGSAASAWRRPAAGSSMGSQPHPPSHIPSRLPVQHSTLSLKRRLAGVQLRLLGVVVAAVAAAATQWPLAHQPPSHHVLTPPQQQTQQSTHPHSQSPYCAS